MTCSATHDRPGATAGDDDDDDDVVPSAAFVAKKPVPNSFVMNATNAFRQTMLVREYRRCCPEIKATYVPPVDPAACLPTCLSRCLCRL